MVLIGLIHQSAGILFLFLMLIGAMVLSGLIGTWVKSKNQIYQTLVLIIISLVYPLILLFFYQQITPPKLDLTPRVGLSYDFDFSPAMADNLPLLNDAPVFKGLWFELLGGVDALSLLFVMMAHIVAIMTILFAALYSGGVVYRAAARDLEAFKLVLFSVLLMTFLLDILFLTTNLVIMFILAELTLLPLSFLMLKDNTVFWRSKFVRFSPLANETGVESHFENKRPLAFYYLIFFTIVSGGLGLFGIALLYLTFGTTSLVTLSALEVSRSVLDLITVSWLGSVGELNSTDFFFSSLFSDYLNVMAALFLVVFWIAVKVPLAPVHIWLPKAHVEGSTESSMILAGIILKITVYILLRLLSLPFFLPLFFEYKAFFLAISVLTAVIGAFGALLTTDLKRIVAYSSVSHMGIILSAGFFIVSSPLALFPYIVLLLTHTIVSTAMFMMVGCVYKSRFAQFISRNKLVYGGLLYIFPSFFLFGIIVFANLNIPLTMGFVGELGTLIALVQSGLTVSFILCVAAFVLLLPMVSMLGQLLMGPVRTVDFFNVVSKSSLNLYDVKVVFTGLVWTKSFIQFYFDQYLYFWMTVVIVIVFGVIPFVFADFLEIFTLNQSIWFNVILDEITATE